MPRPEGQVMASMSLQRFLRGYPTLAGMTGHGAGRGRGAARHLRPPRRRDSHPPAIPRASTTPTSSSRTARPRTGPSSPEVIRAHRAGRPVLAGTLTVEESDRLAARVAGCRRAVPGAERRARRGRSGNRGAGGRARRRDHRHQHGRPGHRHPPGWPRRSATAHAWSRWAACSSSAPIATRAGAWTASCGAAPGRQGDPGETRFFVSLEDDLLVRHGGLTRLIPAALVPARQRRTGRGRRAAPRDRARRSGSSRASTGTSGGWSRATPAWSSASSRRSWPNGWRSCAARIRRVTTLVDDERSLRVAALDRLWREHLARCADLRDGAHLARLGGRQPLDVYTTGATASFGQFHDDFESAAAAIRRAVRAGGPRAPGPAPGGSSHDVDLSGERRSVPPHDGQPAHRPGGPDHRDVCGGDARAPVPGLGRCRSLVGNGAKRKTGAPWWRLPVGSSWSSVS